MKKQGIDTALLCKQIEPVYPFHLLDPYIKHTSCLLGNMFMVHSCLVTVHADTFNTKKDGKNNPGKLKDL